MKRIYCKRKRISINILKTLKAMHTSFCMLCFTFTKTESSIATSSHQILWLRRGKDLCESKLLIWVVWSHWTTPTTLIDRLKCEDSSQLEAITIKTTMSPIGTTLCSTCTDSEEHSSALWSRAQFYKQKKLHRSMRIETDCTRWLRDVWKIPTGSPKHMRL